MVSIIIVNYLLKKELFDCVKSIIASEPRTSFEIIIVDNSEKDEVSKKLSKIYSKTKYYKTQKNLGYGSGNNFGVERSKGEFIFILNPDTRFHKGKISSLINFIKSNKKIGAVAPQLLGKDGQIYDEQGAKELTPLRAIKVLSFINKIFPKNKYWKEYWGVPWDKNKPKMVDVVPGTAFLIKKDIFKKIGGFDENFFLYFDEFDFCKRLRDAGYKNYIHPALKINHSWGSSTSKNKFSNEYFLKSRFYYFKKHFGLIKSLIVESVLRVNKYLIALLLILLLALFLRIYRLPESMHFIGDTAWFFISAKNLITHGELPLVGITSSHTWLHQGAFWTYILAALLPLSKFNPINVAYFTAVFDVVTLIIIYFFTKTYFNQKIAIIASLFYASSPLLILNSQIPYHTNPIPFFTILLIWSVLKWLEGNIKFFPISIFLTAVLYNFQISILPLAISVALILIYGIYKKESWVKGLLGTKIIFISIIAFMIPMFPMLIFDLSHGFSQTLKVGVWAVYRVAVLFGYPPVNPKFSGESWTSFINFISDYLGRIYFLPNTSLAILLFISSILFLIYQQKKTGFRKPELNVLFIFTIIPVLSYIAAKTNSAAYLPMIFPQIVILFGYLFGSIKGRFAALSLFLVISITTLNTYFFLNMDRGIHTIDRRIEASKKIITEAKNRKFNLEMGGSGSEYESFRSNYIYILWWLGNEPVNTQHELKFYIEDTSDSIIIRKINSE